MSSIELVAIDADPATALRRRLEDRGHAVRMRGEARTEAGVGDRAALEAPDLVVAVTGQRPLDPAALEALLTRSLSEDLGTPATLHMLCATLDPTPDGLAALYAAGFDHVLGAAEQRDLVQHIEGIAGGLERRRASHLRPPNGPEDGAALATVTPDDLIARRRADKHWWSLDSLESDALRAAVARHAQGTSPVLVRGEHGAGRRHVARTLHEASQHESTRRTTARRNGAFVQVAAQRLELKPDELRARLTSLLGLARDGTLCVTNLLSLRPDRQQLLAGMLARAKRTRLVATAAPGARSPELFGSSMNHIDVPALRDRPEAIPRLVARLVHVDCDPLALAALRAYGWPNNIFELGAVVGRAVGRSEGDTIQLEHLPAAFGLLVDGDGPNLSERTARAEPEWRITDDTPISIAAYERALFLRAIDACNGSATAAARLLGLGKSTFYRKLQRLGIAPASAPGGRARPVQPHSEAPLSSG